MTHLQDVPRQNWVRGIVIHHSASPASRTTIEDIREWHKARGFRDVGYHYVITQSGDGWQVDHGRPETQRGAHCKGHNASTLGVCLAGNFSEHPVPPAQWAVLMALLEELLERYDLLTPDSVKLHKDMTPEGYTECPGLRFPAIRYVREELRARGAK